MFFPALITYGIGERSGRLVSSFVGLDGNYVEILRRRNYAMNSILYNSSMIGNE